jgi:hypothetical protein
VCDGGGEVPAVDQVITINGESSLWNKGVIKGNKKKEEEEKMIKDEDGELEEVLSVMGLEELIRLRHRLRKSGKERGRRVMEEEIRKRERDGE